MDASIHENNTSIDALAFCRTTYNKLALPNLDPSLAHFYATDYNCVLVE